MSDLSREEIEKNAQDGDAAAQIELSLLLENEGHGDLSVQWLRRAAEGGEIRARTMLAKKYLTQEPFLVDEGLALLSAAADAGDGEAAHVLATMSAGGLGVEQSWNAALDFTQRSAELGFGLARKELSYLAGAPAPEGTSPENLWKALRDRVEIGALIACPPPKRAMKDPRVFVVENFASPEICDWLIARAKPHLVDARESDAKTGFDRSGHKRTNSLASFDLFRMDLIFSILWSRTAAATEIPSGAEAPNIFRYAMGESYETHFDFIETQAGTGTGSPKAAQRVVTFLLYLNDDYEGGGTEFPAINWGYKGRKGDAMFFWNVDASGAPDKRSMHTGTAPIRGEKWVLSQWIQGRLAPV